MGVIWLGYGYGNRSPFGMGLSEASSSFCTASFQHCKVSPRLGESTPLMVACLLSSLFCGDGSSIRKHPICTIGLGPLFALQECLLCYGHRDYVNLPVTSMKKQTAAAVCSLNYRLRYFNNITFIEKADLVIEYFAPSAYYSGSNLA